MITALLDLKTYQPQEIIAENQALLKEAIWIDLLSPSKEEEAQVEQCLGLNVPTREEMVEIEFSSRLYREGGTLCMTATMIAYSDSADPQLDPVTFILTQHQLITIRYIEPQSFKIVTTHLKKLEPTQKDPAGLLLELLDATVDRLADTLELVGHRLDTCSKSIFRPQANAATKPDYRQLLQQIGSNGDLNTKAGESLVTFSRLITFLGQTTAGSRMDSEGHLRLVTLSKDIASLSDHANFLSAKVNFLLDGTLGMVSIEQNNIIKIVSVAAVIFLPPTLVASIYGMNFHFIPELSWKYGYFLSIGLMVLVAWLPYTYFKYRKWL
jgi:magnesium transporter